MKPDNNRLIHTFSIAARCPETGTLGVAVASKFLAVGNIVPWARAGVGAIATQSWANTSFGPEGLTKLASGRSAEEALEQLLANDEGREWRQVGIVDAKGRSAAFTGNLCHDYAGHLIGDGFACQGNLLVGANCIEAMAQSFESTKGQDLADRLYQALAAGDRTGGDKRGRQGAALYVVREKGSYDGHIDRYVDLRVDDHPDPVNELGRLLGLHRLYFGETDPNRLLSLDGDVLQEIASHLQKLGYLQSVSDFYSPEIKKALHDFVAVENFDTRWREDAQIDEEVLLFMRNLSAKS